MCPEDADALPAHQGSSCSTQAALLSASGYMGPVIAQAQQLQHACAVLPALVDGTGGGAFPSSGPVEHWNSGSSNRQSVITLIKAALTLPTMGGRNFHFNLLKRTPRCPHWGSQLQHQQACGPAYFVGCTHNTRSPSAPACSTLRHSPHLDGANTTLRDECRPHS